MSMDRDIVLTMITHPRPDNVDYCGQTVMNLARSGLASSQRLLKFMVNQNENPANINAGNSLRFAGQVDGCKWVIFIEDDIDVVDDFVDGCVKWLDQYSEYIYRVYVFGCPYLKEDNKHLWYEYQTWPYPIKGFYGTQCFAIGAQDAISLGNYMIDHCYAKSPVGVCYDLLMHDWMKATYPDHTHFLASCPSFVQHVGMKSVISPRDEVHTFPSWPGREWRYQ